MVDSRIEWIDSAKGALIVAVVLLHADSYAEALARALLGHADLISIRIDALAHHARMPLMFLLSGLLYARVARSRRHYALKTGRRLIVTYVIWSFIYLLLIPNWPDPGGFAQSGRIISLLWGDSAAWYLWALALCYILAEATRRVPAIMLILILFALSLLGDIVSEILDQNSGSMLRCAVFFSLGARYPDLVTTVARRGTARQTMLLLANFLLLALNPVFPDILNNAVLDGLAVTVALIVAGWVETYWPTAGRQFARIGRRSLPIYVLNFPLLAMLGTGSFLLLRQSGASPMVVQVYPFILATATIFLALAIDKLWSIADPESRALLLDHRGLGSLSQKAARLASQISSARFTRRRTDRPLQDNAEKQAQLDLFQAASGPRQD